jgi:hypothetical protein
VESRTAFLLHRESLRRSQGGQNLSAFQNDDSVGTHAASVNRSQIPQYLIGMVGDGADLLVLQSLAHRRKVAMLSGASRPPAPGGADSRQNCDDLRENLCKVRGERSVCPIDTQSRDIERAAVAALNRSSLSPQSLGSLEDSLAALSVQDPYAVFSRVCDAAVRQRAGSEYRRRLRRVLKSLGNCAFVPCVPAAGIHLRASSAWLLMELTCSETREAYSAIVLQFLSKDMLSVHHDELTPPFDVEGCLITVVPTLMNIPGRESQGIRLAKICVTSMVEQRVRALANIARTFTPLQSVLSYETRAMLSHDDLEAAVSTLEVICEWCSSTAVCEHLWEEVVVSGSCSWPVSIMLWSRGYGPAVYFERCKARALAVLAGNVQCTQYSKIPFGIDHLLRLEIVIIVAASRVGAENGNPGPMGREQGERAAVIDRFIEEQLEITARLATHRRPVWILALSRQIPHLSQREHHRVATMLYPRVIEQFEWTTGVNRYGAAMEAFRMEIDVGSFLMRLSSEGEATVEGLHVDVASCNAQRHICQTARTYMPHADDGGCTDRGAIELCYTMMDCILRVGLSGLDVGVAGDPRRGAMRASLIAEAIALLEFLRASGDDVVMGRAHALIDHLAGDGRISDAERTGMMKHTSLRGDDE